MVLGVPTVARRTVPSPRAQECSEWLFPHGLQACVTWADVPVFRKMPGKRPGQGESLWLLLGPSRLTGHSSPRATCTAAVHCLVAAQES